MKRLRLPAWLSKRVPVRGLNTNSSASDRAVLLMPHFTQQPGSDITVAQLVEHFRGFGIDWWVVSIEDYAGVRGVDEPEGIEDPISSDRAIEQLAHVHQVIDADLFGFARFPSEDQLRALHTRFDRGDPAVSIRVISVGEIVVRASLASLQSLVEWPGSQFMEPDWLP